jgi:hypothetical protein
VTWLFQIGLPKPGIGLVTFILHRPLSESGIY